MLQIAISTNGLQSLRLKCSFECIAFWRFGNLYSMLCEKKCARCRFVCVAWAYTMKKWNRIWMFLFLCRPQLSSLLNSWIRYIPVCPNNAWQHSSLTLTKMFLFMMTCIGLAKNIQKTFFFNLPTEKVRHNCELISYTWSSFYHLLSMVTDNLLEDIKYVISIYDSSACFQRWHIGRSENDLKWWNNILIHLSRILIWKTQPYRFFLSLAMANKLVFLHPFMVYCCEFAWKMKVLVKSVRNPHCGSIPMWMRAQFVSLNPEIS